MMYSKETIVKYANKVRLESLALDQINYQELHVIISRGNKKIGRVLNVSLLPIFDCGNCKQCSRYCYDIKACMMYKNVMHARAVNSYIYHSDPEKYFQDIKNALNTWRGDKYFRYQVAGDIPDRIYLEKMIETAIEYPDWTFWTYTKMYHIVNAWIDENGGTKDALPENLKIMFSPWIGTKMENPYNMPVFAVRMKDGNNDYTEEQFSNMFKCPGNCDVCKACKRGCIAGENTYNDEH